MESARAYDSGIEMPLEMEMLDEPVIRYVHGSNPNSSKGGMYLCRTPGEDAMLTLKPHTPVYVRAVRGSLVNSTGFAFVETSAGQYGWVRFQAARAIGLDTTNDF